MSLMSSLFKNYSISSDEELMLFISHGKEKAFDELYKRYSKRMLFFFYQKLARDDEKAQDFLQDLFLKLIEKPHLFNPNQKFITWIYTLAANMCKNEYRQSAVRGVKTDDFDFNALKEVLPLLNLPDKFDQHLFAKRLDLALDNLDESHRSVFILRYREDLSIKEISHILGCVEGTVKSRLFYTIQKLSFTLQIFNPHREVI
jgi:RNA polymerase sigma-70 factor (ECF subfamily)